MQSTIISILITSLLTLLTACGSAEKENGQPGQVKALDLSEAQALTQSDTASYVLLSLYHSNCILCFKQLPELTALQNVPARDLALKLVSIDSTQYAQRNLNFLQRLQIDFDTYHLPPADAEQFVAQHYPEWDGSTPFNLIFTRQGQLVEATGMTDPKEVRLIIHEHQTFR